MYLVAIQNVTNMEQYIYILDKRQNMMFIISFVKGEDGDSIEQCLISRGFDLDYIDYIISDRLVVHFDTRIERAEDINGGIKFYTQTHVVYNQSPNKQEFITYKYKDSQFEIKP